VAASWGLAPLREGRQWARLLGRHHPADPADLGPRWPLDLQLPEGHGVDKHRRDWLAVFEALDAAKHVHAAQVGLVVRR